MNERIKQLAEQAGGNPNYKAFRGYFLPPPPDYIDPATVNLKKFAELIVQECMEQVWYTREDGIDGNVSQVIKDRIKKHFGVEEPPVNDVDRILRTIRTRS